MSIEVYMPGKFRPASAGAESGLGHDRLAAAGQAVRRIVLGRTLLGRVGRGVALVAGLGVGVICAVQFNAINAAQPRGLMYDVGGGRMMRLVCEGPVSANRPVVVFESGAFGFSGDWAHVQSQLTAQGVRSCAYDRAGMGLSDPAPTPRDGVNVAKDLETLLAVAKVPAPYVLVGHSMAGARVHLFANRNPTKVAGLVLVDSTTPEAMDDPQVRKYVSGFTAAAAAADKTSRFGILRLLAVTSLGDKVGLPAEEDIEKRWQFGSPSYERTAHLETRNWPLAAAQARQTGALNPHCPVAVVSAGVLDGDEGQQMQALQPPPAMASDHGYVSVVDGATHNGLLGAKYSPAIVKGIDFVLRSATDPDARKGLTMDGAELASR
jgi:pimeloyl-ACP methyl ester carboxylesterase